MKKYILFFGIFLVALQASGWGVTGHRAVGLVAELHLNKGAYKRLRVILGQETLASVSTWMDEIRSDSSYDYATDWHWVTVENDQTYEQSEKNPNGDVIMTIERLIAELKLHTLSAEDELEAIKMLVHLVGDIHQPLHVGCCNDQGGNGASVRWFGANTNLHSVWDSRMIDDTRLSYTELAISLTFPPKATVTSWQSGSVWDWAVESMQMRDAVYTIGNGNLSYEYGYHNMPLVRDRLVKAGIRLAGIFNEIYG